MFKTSGGKYIAPQVIEGQLKQSLLIEQIMVVGEGKNFASALIQPNFEQSKLWLEEQGVDCEDNPIAIASCAPLMAQIEKEIRANDDKFGKWEQVKVIRLTPEAWSVEEGLLTPTMKVKRKAVEKKYQHLIEEMYP
jgi:long-chain acyl-CoA synthetase